MRLRRVDRFLGNISRHVKQRLRTRHSNLTSSGYAVVAYGDDAVASRAWHTYSVAQAQRSAYRRLLDDMRVGLPRRDLEVALSAVRETGIIKPSILEVGCGSGYYVDVFEEGLDEDVDYVGLDVSPAMIVLARSDYPQQPFVIGDARFLPFMSRSVDIVLNGVSLMHLVSWSPAIREAARVSNEWCIFHTVPVMKDRATTLVRKRAYGEETLETIFNESDLFRSFHESGLDVIREWDSVEYNLRFLLGVETQSRTFLCRRS